MDQEKINAYNTEQKKKVDEQSAKELQKDNAGLVVSAVTGSAGVVAGTVRDAAQKTEKATKEVNQSVATAGKDIIQAVTNSQNEVATALNNLVVATVVSKDPQLLQAAKDVSDLLTSIAKAGSDFKSSKLNVLPESLNKLSSSIQSLVDNETSDTDIDYTNVLNDIKDLLSVDDKTPVINVAAPKVMIDTTKFEKAITSLEKAVRDNIVTLPEQDDTAVIEALAGVKGSIDNMTFPVPNYVLPFKDINGVAIQVQLDASGNLPTTGGGGGGGGGTQYADGAARGTATGTIAMVDDGTNIQSLSGDSTGKLNVNNISGTVSLPTGAATSAKQLPDGHNVVITSGTVTADTELPAAAALADTTANPTVPAVGSFLMGWDGTNTVWDRLKQQGLNADAQTAHAKGVLETASNGYVYNGSTWDRLRGDTTGVSVKNIASALPAGTNNIGDVDVLTVNGVAPAFGTGARGATVQRVTIATDDSVPVTNAGTFAVQDSQLVADDAAFTIATTKVRPAGFLADETATDSVDEGDAGAARMTLDRKMIVTVQPHTAGGLSVANFTSGDTYTALTATAQVIKATAGKLYGYYIFNPNAVTSYVMVYNIAAASVTVGTSTALLVFAIPAGSAANIEMANGITFSNAGWSIAAATSGGGNTAPATALEAMVWYL